MTNQLLQKIEASDGEGVSRLIKDGITQDDQAWAVHLDLFPLAQRVLNPPFINPHLPKMHGICRELLPYLEDGELSPLVKIEINEYTRRPKAGEIPKSTSQFSAVSFGDIELAIRQENKEKTAVLLNAFSEQKGKAELARHLLLLGSGYMDRSLGHSVSCTAFILLEMLERSDQDPWPVMASLANYFCQGRFDKLPDIRGADLPSKEYLYQHLLTATSGSSIVDLHHTIAFYAINRVRHLLNEREYAHMIDRWIDFMGAKKAKPLNASSSPEKVQDYAGFYQQFSQRMIEPVIFFFKESLASAEGSQRLGRYLIKGVCDLYQGNYDPHFITGLGSALWVMSHYRDQNSLALNALHQYTNYYFAR